uniref:Uncharacterized protein n=1 Tax=Bombyx mori TaxID=7091 RepID=A0A8R2M1V9_BOMMO|nr:uncharacterized protein LOC119629634 isoform X2 [Bombyx mori]
MSVTRTVATCCFRAAYTEPYAYDCVPTCSKQTNVCTNNYQYPVCVGFKETTNVCDCIEVTPKCFDKCTCENSYIYFPEVEYPMTIIDITPYYGCTYWCE